MSELSECGPERSGVYISISPQNCEKGLMFQNYDINNRHHDGKRTKDKE